jgi:site-specific recombinase
LDSALIRPGRIDRKFAFDYCDRDQIADLFFMFFGKRCDPNVIQSIEDNQYSPAYLSGLFLQYRDNPDDALRHVDKRDDHPRNTPLVKQVAEADKSTPK